MLGGGGALTTGGEGFLAVLHAAKKSSAKMDSFLICMESCRSANLAETSDFSLRRLLMQSHRAMDFMNVLSRNKLRSHNSE